MAHATFGAGLVVRYEGEKVVVLFDEAGYKTLDLALVTERGLLRAETGRRGVDADAKQTAGD